ncbi:hypothetical protein PS1_023769 [Malus domestica]
MVRKLQWWRRWGPRDEDGDNLESEKDMVLNHIFINVTEGGNWNESLGSKHHGHSVIYIKQIDGFDNRRVLVDCPNVSSFSFDAGWFDKFVVKNGSSPYEIHAG